MSHRIKEIRYKVHVLTAGQLECMQDLHKDKLANALDMLKRPGPLDHGHPKVRPGAVHLLPSISTNACQHLGISLHPHNVGISA